MKLKSKLAVAAAAAAIAIGPMTSSHAAGGPFVVGQKVVAGTTTYKVSSVYNTAHQADAKTTTGVLGCFSDFMNTTKDTKATLYVTSTLKKTVYKTSCTSSAVLSDPFRP